MAVCGALCYGALAARLSGGRRRVRLPARGVRAARRVPLRLEVLPRDGPRDHRGARDRVSRATRLPRADGRRRDSVLAAIGAIAAFAAVHIVGVRLGTRLLTTLAVLKLVLIGALVVRGVRERRRQLEPLRPVRDAPAPGAAARRRAGRSLRRRRSSPSAGGGKSPRSRARCGIRCPHACPARCGSGWRP